MHFKFKEEFIMAKVISSWRRKLALSGRRIPLVSHPSSKKDEDIDDYIFEPTEAIASGKWQKRGALD